MPELYELNHRHMAIAEYLIRHPSARLNEISEAVGMSPSWISTVTNSELFRDYFLRRHKEVADQVFVPLHEKIEGVAHAAVEKLGRAVDESTDPNFILAAADKAMKALGFGNPRAPGVQVTNVTQVHASSTHVHTSVVEEARAKILQIAGVSNGPTLPPAEGVQTRGDGQVGTSAPRPALVHQAEGSSGPKGNGSPLREESLGSPRGDLVPRALEEPLG